MYNHDKQRNKITKLHTHCAQGARITPQKKNWNKLEQRYPKQ